jgi:hypothetical protein
MNPEEEAAVIELWRAAATEATGMPDVELVGSFQRHFTARGTGVPANFALVITPAEVRAFKFDPARTEHPLAVGPDQFKGAEASWPRGSVRARDVEPGRMAWGVTFDIDGSKAIPFRTPRLTRNPAAAAVIRALGGEIPAAAD